MHVAHLHTKPLLLLRVAMALAFIACLWRNSVRSGAMREVVAAHRSLLTPAKTAFAIWGLIYLTLFLFVSRECIFPSLSLTPRPREAHLQPFHRIVFASGAIVWSLPVILVLWAITGALYLTTASLVQLPTLFDGLVIWPRRTPYECSSLSDYLCLRLPFTLYFSWTCGATLINVTVSLRGLGYDLNLAVYMVCLAVLLAAHVAALAFNGDIVFGAVGIWTLAWLAAKHETGLSPVDADYLEVIQLVAQIGTWFLVALIAGLVLLRCYVRRYGAPEHEHMDASGGKNANISMYGTL
ncbi:hypothetical protein SPRG_12312 [Saprolegnia parasitica CBS 223.65]|uniref:Uncharacterized protein n=1 Tax=Saprolegnia parasitica (strain CBS 223.65) TaxID=695850 RepID=A0A067BVF6_SAPPC|nr:hypothetical protein SPRG_12312 [Saprolegnia parasitica CBS 223.65]KDO22228.1 hypothetical protein SPRG_12312 [Saprolegnia parasitica CBS 223.65]|eukprot:XP_012207066.1 hypothetical protein SPRG_12312 [Saprolegnia parasitica CBS 223.65]